MFLDEFFDYKNELMKTLCSNKEIVRLVTDSSSAPVPNYDLAYSQIFPYEYIPDVVETGKTFICFDVDIASVADKTYYVPAVYLWVFTHKSKMRLDEGGIRVDKLASEIDKELNGNRNFGLGELNLSSVRRFSPISDYQGRVLSYSAKDFNRIGVSRRPPANRKLHE
jgi:hypothetical protein